MKTIIDFELAEDTKALLNKNDDADCITPELKQTILATDDFILLKVEKTIDSPIKIISAKEINSKSFDSL